MTAEELYEKEFGNADSIPKESVIRLLRHFGKVLDVERNSAQQSKMDYSEVGVNDIANKWASYLPIGHIIEGRDAMVEDIYGLLNAHAKTIADKIINEQKSEIKMPTKEAIVQYFNNHFNCHADVIIGDYETTEAAMTVDAVLKLIEWLRNQITEKK